MCAAVGAAIVMAVHYGRDWADGTCARSSDCLSANASIQRNMLLAIAVALAPLVLLWLLRVHRAWLVVPVAFVVQGFVMFVVEHADGFWLPLWLDVIIGAATWSAAGSILTRRKAPLEDGAAVADAATH